MRATVRKPAGAKLIGRCSDCQRRSGSPFGGLASYPDDSLKVTGKAKR